LLEVLIAMLILSIGLLGFARAEIMALHHNEAAYLQSLAVAQLNSLAERLRACNPLHNSACAAQQIASWKNENKHIFPQAKNTIRNNGSAYTFTLQWRTPTVNNARVTADATLQMTL
jgi:type IV pilus assembly protein PilV